LLAWWISIDVRPVNVIRYDGTLEIFDKEESAVT